MSKVGEVQFLKAVKMQNKLGRRANSCEKCETIAIKLMFYGGKRLSFRIEQIDLEKPFWEHLKTNFTWFVSSIILMFCNLLAF